METAGLHEEQGSKGSHPFPDFLPQSPFLTDLRVAVTNEVNF